MMWRVEMFGGLVLRRSDGSGEPAVTRFRTRKAAALLARLALDEKPVAREVLVDALWPEAAPESGRNSLRVALASLRRQLEPPGTPAGSVLHADRAALALDGRAVTSDVREFRQQLHAAGLSPTSRRREHLERACRLYGRPLLPGFYEDWVSAYDQQLANAFLWASRELAALLQHEGRHEEARFWEQERQRLESPQREGITGARSPSTGFRVPGATPALEIDTPFSTPAPSRPAQPPLPALWNGFFGRQDEVRSVLGHLESGERIVTLHGMGGCGKTRLALEVAHLLRVPGASTCSRHAGTQAQAAAALPAARSYQTVAWVALAGATTGEAVADAIANALRQPSQPQSPERPPLEAAAAILRGQQALLVLDNFEQVVDEGVAVVRALLEPLPGLQVLVTSRLRLGAPTERAVPLSPLPIPATPPEATARAAVSHEADALEADALLCPSVAMFVDRAQRARADFSLTRRNSEDILAVVRALEGLPLAIELAAARAGSLSVRSMREQVRRPLDFLRARRSWEPRHDALRSCIAWSFGLLSAAQREFWARLWVFRGGFTLGGAAFVCGGGLGRSGEVLDALAELREASMLTFDAERERYSIPEVLRPFAEEQLQPGEHGALVAAHGQYLRGIAEDWEHTFHRCGLTRPEIEDDVPNIRALCERALATSADPGAASGAARGESVHELLEDAWRTFASLAWFWASSGHVSFALESMDRLFEAARAVGWRAPGALAAKMEMATGLMALHMASTRVARAHFERALGESQALGDASIAATAHNYLGSVAMARAEFEAARAHYALSLELHRARGDERHVAIALCCLASAEVEAGETDAASRLCQQARQIWRGLQDGGGLAWTLCVEGDAAARRGDLEAACLCHERALELRLRHCGTERSAGPLAFLGHARLALHDEPRAASLLCQSARLHLKLGRRRDLLPVLEALAGVAPRVALPPASTWGVEEAQERRARSGARALGAAQAWRREMEVRRLPSDAARWERSCQCLQQILGRATFEAERGVGESLTLEEATRLLLGLLEGLQNQEGESG